VARVGTASPACPVGLASVFHGETLLPLGTPSTLRSIGKAPHRVKADFLMSIPNSGYQMAPDFRCLTGELLDLAEVTSKQG